MLRDFTKEPFDIVIQAGQSNSEGAGYGAVERPFEPRGEILHMNWDRTITVAGERVVGNMIWADYSLSFCTSYINDGRLSEGRKLLVVRSAVGGTGFLDKRWGPTDDLYLQMMDMIQTALSLNPANQLVALLWHQGETDAMMEAGFEGHKNNLRGLLKAVRDTFDCPKLPFVAGDFVQDWKVGNLAICEPVVDAMRAVCAEESARFVGSDGLLSNNQVQGNDDSIHFSRAALYELGERYYAAYCDIVK